jgi:hypothetical protein
MRHFMRILLAVVAAAGLALPGAAQTSSDVAPVAFWRHPFQMQRCVPSLGMPTIPAVPTPIDPKTPTPSPTPSTQTPSLSDALSGAGQYKSTLGSSSVVAGTGIGGAVSGNPVLANVFVPMVIPGLFSVASAQSAVPVDRVYFNYGFFDRIGVVGVGPNAPVLVRNSVTTTNIDPNPPSGPPIVTTTTTTVSSVTQAGGNSRVAGFNLHAFNLGLEKTFLDNLGSFYFNVPVLLDTDNVTPQRIRGWGDVSVGVKILLYRNEDTGSAFTGGLTVALPTARDAVITSLVQTDNGTGGSLVPSSTTTLNPTFFQPWLAGLLVRDRFFVHEYFGVVVPTDSRVATFINNDLTFGYSAYRSVGMVSSLTPTAGVHVILPLNHQGTPPGQLTRTSVPHQQGGAYPVPFAPTDFRFAHQVFATGGLQVGLGERTTFNAAVVIPIAGPRGFNIGATFGLNYFY